MSTKSRTTATPAATPRPDFAEMERLFVVSAIGEEEGVEVLDPEIPWLVVVDPEGVRWLADVPGLVSVIVFLDDAVVEW